MTLDRPYSAQKQNPLLYWTTLVYMVGAPNFLHFDTTGRTHELGLFNLTSISQIVIALGSVYVLTAVLFLSHRPLLCRKVNFAQWLWFPLLFLLVVATVLHPRSNLTPSSAKDVIISLYRLFEWVLAFALFLALYTRTPLEHATEMVVQLIGRASWIWTAIVWIVLPVMPAQVFGISEESTKAVAQLGGQLISPSYFATLSVAAFFYALFYFPRGLATIAGCMLAFVDIVLARTRIELISFLFLLIIYAIFFSGKFILRMGTIIGLGASGVLGILFRDLIFKFLSRGQSLKTLSTLDDRTRVWQATYEAARIRPFIGYGFIVGAKNAIKDHWKYTHWTPPHAHNELLHAWVSGGIFTAIIVLCLYGRALWTALKTVRQGTPEVFLFLFFLHFVVRSIGGPNLIVAYGRVGAVFLLTFIGIVANPQYASRRRLKQSKKTSAHLHPQEVGA
ncbi:O-antigen ligase family protein [Tunturibacter empetritectus]|uniref:O-antigen ligase n=1 Tax=Tunturiibacter lichenicola TaxID=2051959 RepID=A0A7W8N671_9BACT|nr:O-antigen ligase family protein [Edaphobacter lichenicola]MBB5345286.1 O-antigen ligase [Edaphobacter lichenicola]